MTNAGSVSNFAMEVSAEVKKHILISYSYCSFCECTASTNNGLRDMIKRVLSYFMISCRKNQKLFIRYKLIHFRNEGNSIEKV